MHWRLRWDIVESDAFFILVDYICRDLFSYNLVICEWEGVPKMLICVWIPGTCMLWRPFGAEQSTPKTNKQKLTLPKMVSPPGWAAAAFFTSEDIARDCCTWKGVEATDVLRGLCMCVRPVVRVRVGQKKKKRVINWTCWHIDSFNTPIQPAWTPHAPCRSKMSAQWSQSERSFHSIRLAWSIT